MPGSAPSRAPPEGWSGESKVRVSSGFGVPRAAPPDGGATGGAPCPRPSAPALRGRPTPTVGSPGVPSPLRSRPAREVGSEALGVTGWWPERGLSSKGLGVSVLGFLFGRGATAPLHRFGSGLALHPRPPHRRGIPRLAKKIKHQLSSIDARHPRHWVGGRGRSSGTFTCPTLGSEFAGVWAQASHRALGLRASPHGRTCQMAQASAQASM